MKHHIKHHTFCLTMRFLSMWAKHRKNYAYNLISKLFAGKTQLMEKPESCLHWNALASCNLLWRKCTHAHIGCIGHTHILAVATINPASANCEIVFAGNCDAFFPANQMLSVKSGVVLPLNAGLRWKF